MPNQSGRIYLLVNSNGQYRLIILTRPTPARTGRMHGILTTLLASRGAASRLLPCLEREGQRQARVTIAQAPQAIGTSNETLHVS